MLVLGLCGLVVLLTQETKAPQIIIRPAGILDHAVECTDRNGSAQSVDPTITRWFPRRYIAWLPVW